MRQALPSGLVGRVPVPEDRSWLPLAKPVERANSAMICVVVPRRIVALALFKLYGEAGFSSFTYAPPIAAFWPRRTCPSTPPTQNFGPPSSTS